MRARYEGGPHDGMQGRVPLDSEGRPPADRKLQVIGELYSRNFRGKGVAKPRHALYDLVVERRHENGDNRQLLAVYRYREPEVDDQPS